MNAPGGGESGGFTRATRFSCVTDIATGGIDSSFVGGWLAQVSFGLTRVAGNCVLTMQQLVWSDTDGSDSWGQQLCALFCVGCRHVPNGAIISPISKMAIAARWKELRNMVSGYHFDQSFR